MEQVYNDSYVISDYLDYIGFRSFFGQDQRELMYVSIKGPGYQVSIILLW